MAPACNYTTTWHSRIIPGSTVTSDDANLSLDTLARDLGDLVRAVYGDRPAYELVLVGHSLGGAVVTEAAVRGYVSGTVLGVVVLDVVEGKSMMSVAMSGAPCWMVTWCAATKQRPLMHVQGTALESLAHMDGIVRARPHRFKTTDEAVDWAYVLNAMCVSYYMCTSILLDCMNHNSPQTSASRHGNCGAKHRRCCRYRHN